MSPTQARSGAVGAKSRRSRSTRLGSNRPGSVVRLVGPGVHAPQLITYSAHPHPPPVRRVDLSDPLGEGGVVQRAGGRWPLAPLVETLPRHVQHATHERDRECLLRGLLRDKREPYWFWLAKKAAAEM